MSRGFTLLEVLVALTILALAMATLVPLSSHGLRLVRLSDEYQEAVSLADRLVRSLEWPREGVDEGRDGGFRWERRVALVTVPDDLTPPVGPSPRLYALSVTVRWGATRSLELASLRTLPGTPDQ